MFDDCFSRTYIINLPARADRRREMSAELKHVGKSLDDPDVSLFAAIRPDDVGAFPSIGARGCFLSHLGVLADAERRAERSIAILEDDALFTPDFSARAKGLSQQLGKTDWRIFYGGHRGVEGEGLTRLAPGDAVQTTHFVCFRGEAISAARRYLEAMLTRPAGAAEGGPMHVDGAYNWFRRDHPEFAAYAAFPALAGQRSSRSDVAGLRWFDRAPLIRDAAGLARRWLRRE